MKVMIQAALLALAAPALICLAQSANQQNLAAILKQRYADQTLILRRAVDKNNQVYDSTGTLLSGEKNGPWTVYAGVNLNSISLSSDELRLEGERQEFVFDRHENALAPIKKKESIELLVKLEAPVKKIEEAEALLHKVFALTDDDVIASVPDFWQPYLRKRVAVKENPPAAKPSPKLQRRMTDAQAEKKFGVTAPKPVFTPEPSYTKLAQHPGLQGVVVLSAVIDEAGKVVNPYIVRPLGLGLDEQAIEAVKTWKFKPATRNGQPAKIEMALEIAFNLD
jgi:TonB family protein